MFRIGIAGCGYWGANIMRTLKEMEGVVVEALADPDSGARQRAASILGSDVKTHASFEMLLSDKIDGVVVASLPHLHVEQAVAALNKGKAVFVEKPPCLNLPDLERLLEAGQGKTLLCDYVFVYNPLVKFAKGLMEEIDFRLVTADLRWTNWGIVRKDVDAWWSAGPHPVSVLSYLFGQKRMRRNWLRSTSRSWAKAEFVFQGDTGSANVFVSWMHPTKERRIELVGAKQTILIRDETKQLWVVNHENLGGERSIPNVEYSPSPLRAALNDFVRCAKTSEEPVCGADMIRDVTRLMV